LNNDARKKREQQNRIELKKIRVPPRICVTVGECEISKTGEPFWFVFDCLAGGRIFVSHPRASSEFGIQTCVAFHPDHPCVLDWREPYIRNLGIQERKSRRPRLRDDRVDFAGHFRTATIRPALGPLKNCRSKFFAPMPLDLRHVLN
jgi:hypothetical protein